VHLGFYRDQDGAARRTLGIDTGDKTKDGVKVVVWTNDGEKVVYGAWPRRLILCVARGSNMLTCLNFATQMEHSSTTRS
jgi:hypothetical protein